MVKPRADGVVLTFEAEEVAYLRAEVGRTTGELDGGVPEHGVDAVRDRLFPRAYVDPTEDRAEHEFQSVVHDDLVQAKSTGLGVITAALDGGRERRGRTEVVLATGDLEGWVGGLNDVRLVLGTVLGVTDDDTDGGDRAPLTVERAGYDWLTEVQGMLIAVLMGEA
jgi:hypothetical protein